jgi:hypothetical protein
MPDNITNAGRPWQKQTVAKLQELWSAGVPTALIAQTLGRQEGEVGAKAVELKLQRPH